MSIRPDYYKILGVARQAEGDDVKKAFRKLAMKLHPDIDPSPGATDRFIQLNEAYEILSDPRKRGLYDRSLQAGPTRQSGRPTYDSRAYNEWVAQAQRRAQAYSRMNYQQFEKDRFDIAQEQVYFYLQYLSVAMMFMMAGFLLVFPVILFVFADWIAILAIAFTLPMSVHIFSMGKMALRELREKE